MYEWSVDGRRVQRGASPSFEYTPDTPGRHRVSVVLHGPTAVAAADAWEVTARERRPPRVEPSTARQEERVPPAEPPRVATVPRATLPPPVPPTTAARIDEHAAPPIDASRVTRSATALSEEEVQHWFAEYAHAWSSHDVGALQRMGQVRSQADAERLTRYFGTIENLRVDGHIRDVKGVVMDDRLREARVAELADARDLGSRGQPWGFESPLSHAAAWRRAG